MPKLKCESQTNLTPKDAFEKLKGLLENDKELRSMDSSYKCSFNDSELSGSAKGSKFEAELRVQARGAGAAVSIDVSLPLLLTPVKGLVQSTLQKKMDAILA